MKKTAAAENYARWIIAHRCLVLIASVLIFLATAAGMQHYLTDPDYRVYFDDDNPELNALERLEANYVRNDNTLFIVTAKQGDLFTPQHLGAIEWLSEAALQLPFSTRVDSLTNFRRTIGRVDEDGEEIIDSPELFENAITLSAKTIADKKQFALEEPQLEHSVISADGRVSSLNVIFNLPDFDPESRKAKFVLPNGDVEFRDRKTVISDVVADIRQLRDEALGRYPDLQIDLNGILFLNNAFSEASTDDQKVLMPIALVLIFVLLALFLRSVVGIIGTFAVMLFSVLGGMGLAFWSDIVLNSVTTMTPVIILSLAVAHCVHIIVTLQAEMRGYKNHTTGKIKAGIGLHEAIVESMRVNMMPIFLTSVTTAIGLLTLNFSESPPFRDLGNIVAIGVMTSWFFGVFFLPAFLAVMPGKAVLGFGQKVYTEADPAQQKASPNTAVSWRERGALQTSMLWLAERVIKHRWVLLIVGGTVAGILVASIPLNKLDDTYVHYFEKGTEFRDVSEYVDGKLGGILPWHIEVCIKIPDEVKAKALAKGEAITCNTHGESFGIVDPLYLQDLETFTEYLRGLKGEVGYVNSFTDVIKRLNKVLFPQMENGYQLPENRAIGNAALTMYEMSLPEGFDINNQVNINRSGTRLYLTIPTSSSQEQLDLAKKIEEWAHTNLSNIEPIRIVGTPLMFASIGERNIKEMLLGTLIALLLISALLVIVFKSLRIGLISIFPNILPVAMAFGIWGLLVSEVGIALSIVASMTLGIVVDDTVHILSKYLRARREQGLNAADAIRYAFSTVGTALWVTSIALVGGFLVVATASYLPMAQMGLMTALTIMVALLADFLLLPPLLLWLDRKDKSNQKSAF